MSTPVETIAPVPGIAEIWDRSLAPRPDGFTPAGEPFFINIDNGTTVVDLVGYAIAGWAIGSAVTAVMIFIHSDYELASLKRLWYMWLLWPIILPFRLACYQILRGQERQLLRSIRDGTLPRECSKTKRWGLNTMMPGMGDAYCSLIETLNHAGSKVTAFEQLGLTALQEARCGQED